MGIPRYEELQFWHNFMFHTVMTTNEKICREVVELCIGRKVRGIRYKEGEKSLQIMPSKRGIRLDVYLEDDDNTVYDLEMQTTEDADLGMRIRYYDGVMSLNALQTGTPFRKLPQSYIVFICRFDPFDRNRVFYEFSRRDRYEPDLILYDKSLDIIINATGDTSGCSPEMQEFLATVRGDGEPGDGIGREITEAVEQIKNDPRWRVEYMLFETMIQDSRAEGIAEGRAEGITEGRAEGIIIGKEEGRDEGRNELLSELIQKYLQEGKTDKEILSLLPISAEFVEMERNRMRKFD